MRTSLIVSTLLFQMNLLLTVTAEEPRRRVTPATQPAAPQSVRIINLANSSPEKVANMLDEVYRGAGWRFVPDERTKSLFISGTGEPPPGMLESIKQADSPSPEGSIRVFSLQYANPEELCRVLQTLPHDSQFRCSPDRQNQKIVIRAVESEWGQLNKLIEQMDAARDRADAPTIQITPLKRQLSNDLLKEIMGVIGVKDVKIAFDRERNAVIASGAPDATERLSRLLQRLDQTLGNTTRPDAENAPAKTQPFRARLVWLISNPTKQDGNTPPPADLKPVIDELAANGIEGLQMVSQTIVPTQGGDFSIATHPGNALVQFEGSARGARNLYQIQLRVNEETQVPNRPPMAVTVVDVRTQLEVPMSHPIVLAVTPTTGQKTSAFVLEFLPTQ